MSKLDSVLRFHIRFFQLMGYQTLSLNSNQKLKQRTEQILIVWTLMILVISTTATINTFLNSEEYLFTEDKFGNFNDSIKVITSQVALVISYLESIFRRREMFIFWQQYIALKTTPSTKSLLRQLQDHSRFLCIHYGITAGDTIVLVIYFTVTENLRNHMIYFWFMFTPYIFAVRCRNVQCIFHIECIRKELQQLAAEMQLLADYTNFAKRIVTFKGFDEFVRRKLLGLQLNYERVYKMYWNFQKSFGFSIIAFLLMEYVRVLVDLYFIYYTYFRKSDPLGKIIY